MSRRLNRLKGSKSSYQFTVVDPKFTSLECPACHKVDKVNRNKEKFLCGQCGHSDDADTNGSINIAHRGVTKLGTSSLLVVSQKVTSLEPASQEADARRLANASLSSEPRDEPGNPAKSIVKQVQLRLLTVKSVAPKTQPKARKKRNTQEPKYMQLNLFVDWDVRDTTS